MSSALPLTRSAALEAWEAFLPRVPAYAARRNEVEPGHPHISRLSAALRHRLLTEDEIITHTLATHDFSTAEKWLQEVCWRRYWKGWLEHRPSVWHDWRRRVRLLRTSLPTATLQRVEAVAAGTSGVACMDAIAHELTTTGYLHNHARMWWASFWVHVERLPWELGADFFFRHLLDADPASNTLSWRWVAGLHTQGKTYLVRLSNLQRYAPGLLLEHPRGADLLADHVVSPAVLTDFPNPAAQPLTALDEALTTTAQRPGLWLHADDLCPAAGPLANIPFVAVAACSDHSVYRHSYGLSEVRIRALDTVLNDGLCRAATHFQAPATLLTNHNTATALAKWALEHRLDEIVAAAPTIGPIHDFLPALRLALSAAGVPLRLVRRPSDAHAFSLARTGFFPFWQAMSRHLQAPAAAVPSEKSPPTMHLASQ